MIWIEVLLHAGESLDAMMKTVTKSTSVSEQGTLTPSVAFCLVEHQEDAGIKNLFLQSPCIMLYKSVGALLEAMERAYQAQSSTKMLQFYDVLPLIL
jgi:hypothetical protein